MTKPNPETNQILTLKEQSRWIEYSSKLTPEQVNEICAKNAHLESGRTRALANLSGIMIAGSTSH